MVMIAEWAKKAYDESTASDDAIIYSRWHNNLGYIKIDSSQNNKESL